MNNVSDADRIKQISYGIVKKVNEYISERPFPVHNDQLKSIILNFMQPYRVYVSRTTYRYFKPKWIDYSLKNNKLEKLALYIPSDEGYLESNNLINHYLKEGIENFQETNLILTTFNTRLEYLSKFKF